MKKFLSLIVILITVSITTIPVHAESFAEKCQRMQREADEQFLKELEAEGNLTQEALDSYKGKSKLKANKKTTKEKTTEQAKSGDSAIGKGLVYGVDELHVTGLPTDERGYTQAGNYGNINE